MEDLELENKMKTHPIISNIIKGDLDKIISLSESIDLHDDNDEAILWAASFGKLDIFKYLEEKGLDIHVDNDDAFILSIRNGHVDIFEYLLEKGLDIHTNDNYALINSVCYNQIEMVKFILKIVKEPTKSKSFSKEKLTDFVKALIYAIQIAEEYEYVEILEILEEWIVTHHLN
jgi:ankyrin repeat protein